ncbi:MAG: thioredoxin family protein, partial [Nonlabens sp.]|nr:thioredoxin family protein [Nonlabens sp.]
AAWKAAIAKDGMTWFHVSRLQHWNDPIAKMYNVTGIPATFLLDENGHIIAKNLRGMELHKKLAEVLD